MSATPPSEIRDDDALPSQGVRTALNFLLFLHLFALFVAVFSNAPSSQLLTGLRSAPGVRHYLQLLDLDFSYRFHLMVVDDLDMDFFIEADLVTADGTRKRVVLPDPDARPGVRWRRQERLAWQVARQVLLARRGQSAGEAVLPQAIATTLLAENRATSGTLRCRGHLLQARPQAASSDPEVRDPFGESYYRTVYEAEVLVSEGEVLVVPIRERGETAPVSDETAAAEGAPDQ